MITNRYIVNKDENMNYLLLTLLGLLNVSIAVSQADSSSTVAGQSSSATPTTTPQPLTFKCVNGFVSNISGKKITEDALLVKNGTSESLCHLTDISCVWQNKTMLHVIYDPKEKDKSSKFVAGQLFRYELQCKSGYLSKAYATALEIHSLSTKKYFHEEHTVTPPPKGKIQVKIYKLDNTVLTEKVHVGDTLALKIIGPASYSLKPINCTAYPGNIQSQKYTLWNNTQCSSYDDAIMSNVWKKENETTIAIDMFAFRFVDSYSVTIECSAYVCPQNDLNCGVTIKNCMTASAPTTNTPMPTTVLSNNASTTLSSVGRRRRSMIKNDQKEHEEDIASTSFTVVNSFGDSNGSAGLFLTTSVQFMMLLVCMYAIG